MKGQKVCPLLWLNTISSRVLSLFCLTEKEWGKEWGGPIRFSSHQK